MLCQKSTISWGTRVKPRPPHYGIFPLIFIFLFLPLIPEDEGVCLDLHLEHLKSFFKLFIFYSWVLETNTQTYFYMKSLCTKICSLTNQNRLNTFVDWKHIQALPQRANFLHGILFYGTILVIFYKMSFSLAMHYVFFSRFLVEGNLNNSYPNDS